MRNRTRTIAGAIVVAIVIAACSSVESTPTTTRGSILPPTTRGTTTQQAVLASNALVPFDACEPFLDYIIPHALEMVGPYGLEGGPTPWMWRGGIAVDDGDGHWGDFPTTAPSYLDEHSAAEPPEADDHQMRGLGAAQWKWEGVEENAGTLLVDGEESEPRGFVCHSGAERLGAQHGAQAWVLDLDVDHQAFPVTGCRSCGESDLGVLAVGSAECDNVGGGRLAAEYFLDMGHRRLACVAGDSGVSLRDRWDGFRHAVTRGGAEATRGWAW